MDNRVKILREEKNMTQTELAEKSGLSLRTVQRIEAGSILKGFTLRSLAESLETEPENLVFNEIRTDVARARLINMSALSGLVIPFGGIILPFILTQKTKDLKNKELGRNIVSVQIVLSAVLSVLMIICPFIQNALSVKFPLFVVPLIIFISIKLFIIISNGISLNQKKELSIKLKTSFL